MLETLKKNELTPCFADPTDVRACTHAALAFALMLRIENAPRCMHVRAIEHPRILLGRHTGVPGVRSAQVRLAPTLGVRADVFMLPRR